MLSRNRPPRAKIFRGTVCWQLLVEQRCPQCFLPTDLQQSCPSRAQGSPPQALPPLGPSPWLCTLHRRLAPCPAAGGSQSLQLEKKECVCWQGLPRHGSPLPSSHAGINQGWGSCSCLLLLAARAGEQHRTVTSSEQRPPLQLAWSSPARRVHG